MGLFDQLRSLFRSEAEPLSDQEDSWPPKNRSKPQPGARQGTRVLIIDDSKTVVMAIKKFLQSAGYVTLEAFDAETGLNILREKTPELVFLDIMLPGMNGFTALRTIRHDPLMRDIPVIMMSGNEQAMEQFYGSKIGADDFLKKPFTHEELFFRIERLLDKDGVPRRAKLDSHAVPDHSTALAS